MEPGFELVEGEREEVLLKREGTNCERLCIFMGLLKYVSQVFEN